MKTKITWIGILCLSLCLFIQCDPTPTCNDGIQNQGERGIDCGDDAGLCPSCEDLATCTDGIQNGDEEGIDCGGNCPNACPDIPTCNDGIQNGDETGVDCGGSCPICDPTDSCNDGIQNGDEEGVDCGGSCPNPCATATCEDGVQNGDEEGIDCGGSCPNPCATATCEDGIQNGDEEGIDCGGSCPNPCATATCEDGIQNGDEEGIDCGGSCPNLCTGTSGCVNEVDNGLVRASIADTIYSTTNVMATYNEDQVLSIISCFNEVFLGITYTGELILTNSVLTAGSIGTCIQNNTGEINFTAIDTIAKTVSGTFRFDCEDVTTQEMMSVTEGSFTDIQYE